MIAIRRTTAKLRQAVPALRRRVQLANDRVNKRSARRAPQRRTMVLVAACVLALALTAACGGGKDHKSASSKSPTTAAPKPPEPVVNPLNGVKGKPNGPVVGVKIDDVAAARPQAGLNDADVVYVEMAEGGLTRLVAVYAGKRPDTVGPVRSVRSSDPELLAQYGPMALAFSGGAANELDALHRSPLVDASPDAHPDVYRRAAERSSPHNLMLNVGQVSGKVAKAAGVKDIGLQWADKDDRVAAAKEAHRISVNMGSTQQIFTWDVGKNRWLRSSGNSVLSDAAGQPIAATNVLVQFVNVTPDLGDIDQAGNPAALTHSTGNGKAVLLRDGHAIDGTWSRPKAGDPTKFVDSKNAPLKLEPGGTTWVLLAPQNSPIATG